MTSPMSHIALGASSQSRLFMLALAREIKTRHGSTIHLYCAGPQEVDYYRRINVDGVFDSITDCEIPYETALNDTLNEDDVVRCAERWETLTGMTINKMVVTDRHLGRGYALGGFYHPRSRQSEQVDYLHMVHAYSSMLEFWSQEIREKGITLCLNGRRELAYIARIHNIPYRIMAGSRYENYHFWAWNEFRESPLFERSWKAFRGTPTLTMDAPYHTHQVNRVRYRSMFSFQAMLRRWARTTAQYAYWHARGYKKAKGYSYKGTMRFLYRMWHDYRRLRRMKLCRLADLQGKRFVFFPLHIEPEVALHGMSPEYFYQHALIAAVSRDLPAGCYLAVKEAFGQIGRRPTDFYRQIADLKNVVLLDVWELGFECASTADAVVTICGTAGLEAQVAGKPVIAFGRHNSYNFLPGVQVVEDESQLAKYLREALDGAVDNAAIRRDASKFLHALRDSSFDMKSYDYVSLSNFETAAVEAAYEALAASLQDVEAPVARARAQ